MPDVRPGGSTIGLSEALEGVSNGQLEALRKNSGKRCSGEEVCAKIGTPNGNPGLRDKTRSIETICDGCDFRHTKPGTQPGHLAPLIVRMMELDELQEGGATFAYPDALSPYDWLCIRALVVARRRDQEKSIAKPNTPKPGQKSQAQLEAELQARTRKK